MDAVDGVVKILKSEGLVAVFYEIAHPVRRQSSRVRQILAEGAASQDSIVARARAL